jgi:acyl-CoA thioester hydrolase|tara:strand:+ start:64 stop:474 length:411 start_codon:yes stop_codon:yes gene_type:complete
MSKNFIFNTKVYYEDTDAGGIVYYANYLKFIERARSEMIKEIGFSNNFLLKNNNAFIIVKSCNLEFKKSARLEDELKIFSSIKFISKSSFKMSQLITRSNELLVISLVHLVFVNKDGKIIKIPEILSNKLKFFLSK